jgi:hypothetical protein
VERKAKPIDSRTTLPNIQIKKAGLVDLVNHQQHLPASDLGRSAIQQLPLLGHGQEPQNSQHHETRDPLPSVCIRTIETS